LAASFLEITEALPCEFHVPSWSPLRAFLECVKHVDCVLELCEIDHAMLEPGVHANLTNAEADGWHRLPVVRIKPTLNASELKSRHLAGFGREAAQIVSGGPEPDYWLLSHICSYKYRHVWSSMRDEAIA
jgi:hypothetical protein